MIAAALLFALLLGGFIFVVLPRGRSWQRASAAALFAVLIAVVYGGSAELLGRPKPLRLEWRDARQAQVIGASMRENEAIYLWLKFEGDPEPRAYALSWSTQAAQQLQTAMQEGEASGTDVMMARPSERGLDDREPMFYAKPQSPLPDKSYGGVGPLTSNRFGNPS